jgi:c-di-GMP-binding flagellar brake protein YcgR
MSIDKRKQPRFDIRLSAEFRGKDGSLVTTTTKNVSTGGAALELPYAALVDDQKLDLSLFLVVEGVEDPSKPPLQVNARVMWTGESDDGTITAGVRFEGLSDAQTKWLERFLEVTASP